MLIILAILFYFRLLDDDKCLGCQGIDCLEPILFSCEKYQSQSGLCWNKDVLNNNCFHSFVEFLNNFRSSKEFHAFSLLHWLFLILLFIWGSFERTALLLQVSRQSPHPSSKFTHFHGYNIIRIQFSVIFSIKYNTRNI